MVKKYRFLWISLLFLGLNSCSTFTLPLQSVELNSIPPGASIYNEEGALLGITPIKIEGEVLAKASKFNRLNVRLSRTGFYDSVLALDLHGQDQHTTKLVAVSSTSFSERLIKDFSKEANLYTRTLLEIQGLLFVGRYDDAEKLTKDFQKNYPNIAAGYLFLSNIADKKGNREEARSYLLRAKSLDENDPVVNRGLAGQASSVVEDEVTDVAPTKSKPNSDAKPKVKEPAGGSGFKIKEGK